MAVGSPTRASSTQRRLSASASPLRSDKATIVARSRVLWRLSRLPKAIRLRAARTVPAPLLPFSSDILDRRPSRNPALGRSLLIQLAHWDPSAAPPAAPVARSPCAAAPRSTRARSSSVTAREWAARLVKPRLSRRCVRTRTHSRPSSLACMRIASHSPTERPEAPAATTAASSGQAVLGTNRRSRVALRLLRAPVPILTVGISSGPSLRVVGVVAVATRTAKGDDHRGMAHEAVLPYLLF